MKNITDNKSFIKTLQKYQAQRQKSLESNLDVRGFFGIGETEELTIVEKLNIEEVDFFGVFFDGLQFKNCKFKNCNFHGSVSIGACIFKDCEFYSVIFDNISITETDFIDSTFFNCRHTYNIFGDCLFQNSKFVNSYEMLELYFGNCRLSNLEFDNCYISNWHFEDPIIKFSNILFVKDSIIEKSSFLNINLENSHIYYSKLSQTSFVNCILSSETISETTSPTGNEFASIDFQSIINSSNINSKVLKTCFGIESEDIKEYIFGLTQKIEFQTVFISYSFKDKDFAKRINEKLLGKGIITFLWEKDAPGGKGLKKIMKENIKKFDRVLFIASEHSIRSEACQFEISEGIKKQSELWSDIFFPIHIDNYLFEIDKDNIKPISKREEYWSNILALREINSIDFTDFKGLRYNQEKYDNLIFKLVKELKK